MEAKLKSDHPDINEYTLSSPPPKDHPDLAKWVWNLWESSYAEKERLGLMDRWLSSYRLFRGNHWGEKARGNKDKVAVNLYFANVQRTVANITAENPVAKVVDLDGNTDKADQVLTLKTKKFWNETEQQAKLASSTLNSENYGISIEKAVWDNKNKTSIPIILDPYSYFPAPGYYSDTTDIPFEAHAFALPVHVIEKTFGAVEVTEDDVKTILGKADREEVRPNTILSESGVGIVHEQKKDASLDSTAKQSEALVVEMWLFDHSTHKVETIDTETGEITETEEKIYPDGVRVITVCNKDKFLNDMPNPNVNFNLDHELIKTSFAWGRKSFYKVNSYEDTTSLWGFSAAEQTGDILKKINEIVSRMVAYCNRALFPTLIIEKGCGITKKMVNNKPNLVLMPTRPNARIEYLPTPNLPANFFQVLDVLTNFHDRIYQIEDADRGKSPTGVTAASAIVALQERNAVLIRHKIRGAEYLCRMRGRWNISFLQNFSIKKESIILKNDEIYKFSGIDLAGRRFNYIVESDSTIAKASAYGQEQAVGLYKLNAIDRTALLETLNIPDREAIIERMGETQLDEAFHILIEAGMPEEAAVEMKQILLQPQTGQGGESGESTPVKPKAQQGRARYV